MNQLLKLSAASMMCLGLMVTYGNEQGDHLSHPEAYADLKNDFADKQITKIADHYAKEHEHVHTLHGHKLAERHIATQGDMNAIDIAHEHKQAKNHVQTQGNLEAISIAENLAKTIRELQKEEVQALTEAEKEQLEVQLEGYQIRELMTLARQLSQLLQDNPDMPMRDKIMNSGLMLAAVLKAKVIAGDQEAHELSEAFHEKMAENLELQEGVTEMAEDGMAELTKTQDESPAGDQARSDEADGKDTDKNQDNHEFADADSDSDE